MVRKEDDTSIPLKKSTRERLGTFGNKNESWDRLLNRLMNVEDENKRLRTLLNAHSLELKELVEEVTELRKGNTYDRKRLDTIRVGITEEELREVRSVLREYYSKESE
jgi:F0F1-type ATP synthase delta subunit